MSDVTQESNPSLSPEEIQRLQDELSRAKSRIAELEGDESSEGSEAKPTPVDAGVDIAPIQDGDVTLRRLVQRIAMILQCDSIVIMFYDRESGELIAIPPTFGMEEEKLPLFRVRATQGVSGEVFRSGEPAIFHDATTDPRTAKENLTLLRIQNGISVPLIIEQRDEENRVTERSTIGVLHALNKRHGDDFNDEDVRLLERMARNVGSIIANLQLYREVVEEREELLQTFESISYGLILVSPEGKISQINSAARALFPDKTETLGQPFGSFSTDESMTRMVQKGLNGEETKAFEAVFELAGVERTYHVDGTHVSNMEGKSLGYVLIMNDVTEQKNLDRMKSSFIAMASHELRTPLTAIKGFVSTLLADDGFEAEERLEFYQIIDHECDRLTRLINDLLNTSRIEAGESLRPSYSKVDAKSLIEKVVVIQRQATRRHTIESNFQTEVPEIVADGDKYDQVLTNLLSNAVKYSPEGGQITVHVKAENGELTVGVQDEGIGIPPDHLGKVFDRFHRVNNEDNRKIYGTGLGLYLVKHLVEQVHLGTIWVESEVGKGSTFWFKTPVDLDVEKAKALND